MGLIRFEFRLCSNNGLEDSLPVWWAVFCVLREGAGQADMLCPPPDLHSGKNTKRNRKIKREEGEIGEMEGEEEVG